MNLLQETIYLFALLQNPNNYKSRIIGISWNFKETKK